MLKVKLLLNQLSNFWGVSHFHVSLFANFFNHDYATNKIIYMPVLLLYTYLLSWYFKSRWEKIKSKYKGRVNVNVNVNAKNTVCILSLFVFLFSFTIYTAFFMSLL